MNEIWNYWGLKPPPICTIKMVLHHKEMRNLIGIITEASFTLANLNCLDREAAILSRLLYKYKRTFRHEKAFQNLSKIYQCLKRYLKLNFSHTLQTFKTTLPKEVKASASHAYLPTRQMLKWLLLRLMAFSQIFARIINLAKSTGTLLYKKLHLGRQTNLSLFVYSVTARILVVSKFLVMKSIEWYNSLIKYLLYLDETTEFVPEFTFPVNLKKWLGDVDYSPLNKKTSIDEVFKVIDLEKDEDDRMIVTENLFKHFRVEVKKDYDFEEVNQVPTNFVEDLGVPVKEENKMKKRQRRKERAKFLKKLEREKEFANRKRKKGLEVVEIDD